MNRSQIEAIVLDALRMANQAREDDNQLIVAPDAPLFGDRGQLDSMGVVTLIIDVEDALRVAGHSVFLADERAMSRLQSPFKDVPALVAYIEECLKSL
jgi:acyl carrier protein